MNFMSGKLIHNQSLRVTYPALFHSIPTSNSTHSSNKSVKTNDIAGTYALDAGSVQLYTVGGTTPDADGSIFIPGKGTFTLNPPPAL